MKGGLRMAKHDQCSVDAIAAQIEEYLVSRPHAADSISGIHQWWLAQAMGDVSLEQVQQALDQLVANGVLLTESRSAGEVVYHSGPRATQKSTKTDE